MVGKVARINLEQDTIASPSTPDVELSDIVELVDINVVYECPEEMSIQVFSSC